MKGAALQSGQALAHQLRAAVDEARFDGSVFESFLRIES